MEVIDAKWLKQLEDENARLKKLLAELVMDVSTLREVLSSGAMSPSLFLVIASGFYCDRDAALP